MKKSPFVRFFALCACASLSFLACSDEKKDPPTHNELCLKGLSKECLTGSWRLAGIENDNNGNYTEVAQGNGSLSLDADGEYGFEGAGGSFNTHYGYWTVNGNTLSITCTAGDCPAGSNTTVEAKITTTGAGAVLRVHGAPFSDYRDGINAPNPVEKYTFMQ